MKPVSIIFTVPQDDLLNLAMQKNESHYSSLKDIMEAQWHPNAKFSVFLTS
jgi:hypothetical protein